MSELLERSARLIDGGESADPALVNPTSVGVHELADGIVLVDAFSHVIALRTGAGLVLVDTSAPMFAEPVRAALRSWSTAPVHTIVYTHGHLDHVGGARAYLDEARGDDRPAPQVVGHRDISARLRRYDATNGYNAIVNARQFGRHDVDEATRAWPRDWVHPTVSFDTRLGLRVGELELVLQHARGETDDHAWVWLPERRVLCGGDFLTWVFPNAGNPQKVQRYPLEWAGALREMSALGAELFLPAHGLPIAGAQRIRGVLDDVATALETLVEQTLALMNAGARLDDIVHTVRVPDRLLAKPYLRPVYDEPEFVVRNIWRLYGGWYDGDPAHLKPAPAGQLAAELAALAGGAGALADRASALAAAGELRLAGHLAELAALAAPGDAGVQRVRAGVFRDRARAETSLMARGIFGAAARAAEAAAGVGEPAAPGRPGDAERP